mgnify:CR=1 FL=1
MRPYTDDIISEKSFIRTFSEDIDPIELMWHRDETDRTIEVLEDTDWKYQIEDDIPINLKEFIFLEKYKFHRLIKGGKDLKIKITNHV